MKNMGFIDAEDSGKVLEMFNFKMVVMEQLRRITRMMSKEMRGGYWQERTSVEDGMASGYKVYVPDTRDELFNAISCLYDLILPKMDKKFKEEVVKIEEEIENKKEEAKKSLDMADLEIMSVLDYENNKQQAIVEQLKLKLLYLYRKMFQVLSLQLSESNYFEGGAVYTEVSE